MFLHSSFSLYTRPIQLSYVIHDLLTELDILEKYLELNHENIHKRSEEFINKLKQIEQECYQNEPKIDKINLKVERKDEINDLYEELR
jgi:hypothetical protein